MADERLTQIKERMAGTEPAQAGEDMDWLIARVEKLEKEIERLKGEVEFLQNELRYQDYQGETGF